jgi:pyruvate dehydrogenase E1 component
MVTLNGAKKIIGAAETVATAIGQSINTAVTHGGGNPLDPRADGQRMAGPHGYFHQEGLYFAHLTKTSLNTVSPIRTAATREHFFGKYPELREMVANMSDEEIWHLNRGGHHPQKVYAAYAAAVANRGSPTMILATTVKGFGLGKSAEGLNVAHQHKKLGEENLKAVGDRFNIQVTDEEIAGLSFEKPARNSEEMRYLQGRRTALGGYLPARHADAPRLVAPPLEAFNALLEGTQDRKISTTMALVRIMATLLRDKNIGKHIVPIIPDEARTFGMEGMFRQVVIYPSVGQPQG